MILQGYWNYTDIEMSERIWNDWKDNWLNDMRFEWKHKDD